MATRKSQCAEYGGDVDPRDDDGMARIECARQGGTAEYHVGGGTDYWGVYSVSIVSAVYLRLSLKGGISDRLTLCWRIVWSKAYS